MPVQLTPEAAQLLKPAGRQEILENMGLPGPIAKLATMMTPDPMLPTPVSTLRLLDLSVRRMAPLARERMRQTLTELGLPDPDLLWKYLQAHPTAVEVRSASHLPAPPRLIGRVVGQTQFPPPPLQGPVEVTVHRAAADRPGVLAHELVEAAAGLAGKLDRPLPGLTESYVGHVPLYQRYGPTRLDAELFPTLFDKPDWVRIHRPDEALRALQEWFTVPPAWPPIPGGP